MTALQTAPSGIGGDRLAGRVVIITGGGRGIGRATAELFARQGAKVMIATRTAQPGRETVDAIAAAGGEASLHTVDLSSRAAVRATIEATLGRFGRLDTIVHNAASTPFGMIGEIDDEALDDVLTVNLKTAFWMIEEALPALAASNSASMLVVSSITGNRQWQTGFTAYGASKAALNSFVRMAAKELGPRGIRVNGVEPGLTLTEAVIAKFPASEVEKIEKTIPLGVTARPEDLAYALLFLASNEASRITGQILSVDAGQNLGTA